MLCSRCKLQSIGVDTTMTEAETRTRLPVIPGSFNVLKHFVNAVYVLIRDPLITTCP